MNITTYNLSAGSMPFTSDIVQNGYRLFLNDETEVSFNVRNPDSTFNVPIFSPEDVYVELYGWNVGTSKSPVQGSYFLSAGKTGNPISSTTITLSAPIYTQTNHLVNGSYSTSYNQDITGTNFNAANGYGIEPSELVNPSELPTARWYIVYREPNLPRTEPPTLLFGTNTSISNLLSGVPLNRLTSPNDWETLSGAGGAVAGSLIEKTRPANTLYKIIADYGDSTIETVDLSSGNYNLLPDSDERYDTLGNPFFYFPNNWKHRYTTFSSKVSSTLNFKFKYENGYDLDFNFILYKSNKSLIDDGIVVLDSQSFHSKEDGTLMNITDRQGTLINAIQTNNIDTSDSNGSDVLYLYLTLKADSERKNEYFSTFVDIATAANFIPYTSENTVNQLISTIPFNRQFTELVCDSTGLSSAAAFVAGTVFNGLNKRIGEVINFNDFRSFINN
jgi:hypothetical protein|tara:strand:+ start:5267 stop:6604 length:1338 start_codon:yes stop_codon:yes gene_type:complete